MSETPAERLRRARLARGYATAADAARAFGWPTSTYTSHENSTRGLRRDAARRYSQAFGIPLHELLEIPRGPDPVDSVPVVAKSAVGVWRDIRLDVGQNTARALDVVIPSSDSGESPVRVAVEVCDQSVNRALDLGDFAICRPLKELELERIPLNALVWVERRRGGLVEQSIRRLAERRGAQLVLSSHSKDSRLSDTITFPSQNKDETVTIKGRVVGRYAPLIVDED